MLDKQKKNEEWTVSRVRSIDVNEKVITFTFLVSIHCSILFLFTPFVVLFIAEPVHSSAFENQHMLKRSSEKKRKRTQKPPTNKQMHINKVISITVLAKKVMDTCE